MTAAGRLVRWHRAGNHSIGDRIRSLSRYRHLTDEEALKLRFPLSEAQEIIAREAGFDPEPRETGQAGSNVTET